MTKAVDFIPLIETKAKSRLIATAEFAHLIPGHHRAGVEVIPLQIGF